MALLEFQIPLCREDLLRQGDRSHYFVSDCCTCGELTAKIEGKGIHVKRFNRFVGTLNVHCHSEHGPGSRKAVSSSILQSAGAFWCRRDRLRLRNASMCSTASSGVTKRSLAPPLIDIDIKLPHGGSYLLDLECAFNVATMLIAYPLPGNLP